MLSVKDPIYCDSTCEMLPALTFVFGQYRLSNARIIEINSNDRHELFHKDKQVAGTR